MKHKAKTIWFRAEVTACIEVFSYCIIVGLIQKRSPVACQYHSQHNTLFVRNLCLLAKQHRELAG